MEEKEELMARLEALLEQAKFQPTSKYLSAKQVEAEFGVPQKTILNRSNLPASHKRHLPSVRLKGGRKKFFERKVINRFFEVQANNNINQN